MEDETRRALRVVDKALRDFFPNDYFKRCMYAAFGIRDVLRARGIAAEIVGGDFKCFMLSRDRQGHAMDGFGGSKQGGLPSHFWLECEGFLLDLGPHYLPKKSKHPFVAAPAVRWRLRASLPNFIQYQPTQRYGRKTVLASTNEVNARMAVFVELCCKLDRSTKPLPSRWDWELTDMASVESAASRGDRWAQGAIRYLSYVGQ